MRNGRRPLEWAATQAALLDHVGTDEVLVPVNGAVAEAVGRGCAQLDRSSILSVGRGTVR